MSFSRLPEDVINFHIGPYLGSRDLYMLTKSSTNNSFYNALINMLNSDNSTIDDFIIYSEIWDDSRNDPTAEYLYPRLRSHFIERIKRYSDEDKNLYVRSLIKEALLRNGYSTVKLLLLFDTNPRETLSKIFSENPELQEAISRFMLFTPAYYPKTEQQYIEILLSPHLSEQTRDKFLEKYRQDPRMKDRVLIRHSLTASKTNPLFELVTGCGWEDSDIEWLDKVLKGPSQKERFRFFLRGQRQKSFGDVLDRFDVDIYPSFAMMNSLDDLVNRSILLDIIDKG